MRLTWVPHEASEAEIACFAAAIDGMGKGWGAGMKLLAELLAELQGKGGTRTLDPGIMRTSVPKNNK
jgi:hypothetical protein